MHEMGRLVVQILLHALDGQTDLKSVRLAPELVIRNSSDNASAFSLAQHITHNTRRCARF